MKALATRLQGVGFVLTELLVAGLAATILLLGIVQMATASSRALNLVESVSEAQQGGRFALAQLRDAVMSAGFNPRPWTGNAAALGLSMDSMDGGDGGSDVLVVRELSDRNCFGNLNPALDEGGRPDFFLRERTLERSASSNLALSCFFGPPGGSMVRQINREGLVQRVESFQLLFAEDSDGDGKADRRVRAGRWVDVSRILGVDIGLLLATQDPIGNPVSSPLTVLDQSLTPHRDGRLRRVWRATYPIVSKLR